MKIAALVPARSGSVRIVQKNLRTLAGEPLFIRKIRQLQGSFIDSVYLGSDSDEYLDLAATVGAKPIKRPDYSCNEDISTANEMIRDFVDLIPNNYDLIVWAHCTNPFLYARHYDDALELFLKNMDQYDSLMSVQEIKNHMWDCAIRPINYDPWKRSHTLAKELKPIYFQTGGIFIQPADLMKKNNYFFGKNPGIVRHNQVESYDVNTEEEFQLAEKIVSWVDSKEEYNPIKI